MAKKIAKQPKKVEKRVAKANHSSAKKEVEKKLPEPVKEEELDEMLTHNGEMEEDSEEEEPEEGEETKPRVEKSKKKTAFIVVLIVLLVAALGVGAYVFFFNKDQAPAFIPPVNEEEEETPVVEAPAVRVIDGIKPANGKVNPQPFAVMVENLSVVRPQLGLQSAPVVYETLAEGGITRFMAVFTDESVDKIGPVRSARPYYLEWSSEYDAIYCHAGGSPDALEAISGLGIDSLNAISGEGRFFYRDSGRAAPHNLFTDSKLLGLAIRDKGLENKVVDFAGWPYQKELALDARPATGVGVRIDFSTPTYSSRYTYNRADNGYMRENGGVPHSDGLTGRQIAVKNVIIQRVPPETSAGEKGRIFLDVTGTGEAVVLRDGKKIVGTWTKENREGRTRFFDETGKEIALNPGNTWVHVVPTDKLVEFTE